MPDIPTAHLDILHAFGRRSRQEDRYVAARIGRGYLLAVLDGHGGHEVAERGALRLPSLVADALATHQTADALRGAVEQLVAELADGPSGSTLSAAYVEPADDGMQVVTAQLGDSAVVIGPPGGDLIVTTEHSAAHYEPDIQVINARIDHYQSLGDDMPEYARWAEISWGYVWASGKGIAMTRALGDPYMHDILIREPEIATHQAPTDAIIMLCTDGVHDTATPEGHMNTYRELIAKAIDGESARAIGEHVLANSKMGDNVTIVLFRNTLEGTDENEYTLWVTVHTDEHGIKYVDLNDLPRYIPVEEPPTFVGMNCPRIEGVLRAVYLHDFDSWARRNRIRVHYITDEE